MPVSVTTASTKSELSKAKNNVELPSSDHVSRPPIGNCYSFRYVASKFLDAFSSMKRNFFYTGCENVIHTCCPYRVTLQYCNVL
jgi:hypothetical protein